MCCFCRRCAVALPFTWSPVRLSWVSCEMRSMRNSESSMSLLSPFTSFIHHYYKTLDISMKCNDVISCYPVRIKLWSWSWLMCGPVSQTWRYKTRPKAPVWSSCRTSHKYAPVKIFWSVSDVKILWEIYTVCVLSFIFRFQQERHAQSKQDLKGLEETVVSFISFLNILDILISEVQLSQKNSS